jgi:hypothetical protein
MLYALLAIYAILSTPETKGTDLEGAPSMPGSAAR